jgi:hypothetical protein
MIGMHLALIPAVERPVPGVELAKLTAKIALALVLDAAIAGILGSMFWLGVRISGA